MKKMLVLMLCVAMMLCACVACGENPAQNETQDTELVLWEQQEEK